MSKRTVSVQRTSLKSLALAARDVRKELRGLGLFCPGLQKVRVMWCAIPQLHLPLAVGFFIHESTLLGRLLGYHAGDIYIPSFALKCRGLRDTLRHEFGHALAHLYPEVVTSDRFREVFGGIYGSILPGPGFEEDFVSPYAAQNPCEDFAETFGLFVQKKGVPPRGLTVRMTRKWGFVRDLKRSR
jgi:hypothetical protein